MRIAILNLPVDNNYGGNLQRYALMKVLQDMGHKPVHLYYRNDGAQRVSFKYKTKYFVKQLFKLLFNPHCKLFYKTPFEQGMKDILRFYHHYIPHTKRLFTVNDFEKHAYYDAYIVGSDQVWREAYANDLLTTMYLGFLKNPQSLRIAYGVSFGTEANEYSLQEIDICGKLYEKFNHVSVREEDGLRMLSKFGWNYPKACVVLDPTLLLTARDYEKLIDGAKTVPVNGDVFCYILDTNKEKEEYINTLSLMNRYSPYYCTLNETTAPSIEQWLRNIRDAKYIITDSYHGVIFSLIFQKPFTVFENSNRGNSRIKELKRLFDLKVENNKINYPSMFEILKIEREKSLTFLKIALQ